ncbi:MAG: hypothetical protein ABI769_03550 [Pseudomonadota bacterium]
MNTPVVSRPLLALGAFLLPMMSLAQTTRFPLTSASGLSLHNVSAEPARLQGKMGLKVMASAETPPPGAGEETLVVIGDLEFGDGVIEAEIAGDVRPGAPEGARGFVGIAFRVQADLKTYDAFYLRPTNGRADDQVRRNHSAQYISHPDWPWFRLRQETPSKYESYVDVVPATWTRIRIEVSGDQARLYVHDAKQPTLIVNDVKSGAHAKGVIALWIDGGTIAHFRNLVVSGK